MSLISLALDRADRNRNEHRFAARLALKSGGGVGGVIASTAGVASNINFGRYSQTAAHAADQYGFFTGYPYAIINVIANRLASQPIRAAVLLKPGERPRKAFAVKSADFLPKNMRDLSSRLEVLPDHRILRVIDDPNQMMVRHTLLYSTFASCEITGRSHWWCYKDDAGKDQIWVLPSHWIQPHHEEDQLFAWYDVMLPGTGEPIKVPTRQIVPFMLPDPSDPFACLAPMQAMARTVMTDFAFEMAQRMSLENGINPGLAIMVGKPAEFAGVGQDQLTLTKEQRDQIVSAIRRQYRGVTRFDEPLILDALIKDVKQITTSPKEMAFKDSGPLIRNRMTQGWGMNPITLGEMEGVNYASSGVADHHVCRNVYNPRVENYSQTMTCYLVAYYSGRDMGDGRKLVIYQEPVQPSDPEMEDRRDDTDYKNGIISRNELRKKRGLEPIVNGDRALTAAGWVRVEVDVDRNGVADDDEEEKRRPARLQKGKRHVKRRPPRRKVRDDEGHEHGADGRFGSGGSGGGSSGSSNRPDHGKVDESAEKHGERAKGFAEKIKKYGAKAVKAAKAVRDKATDLAYSATWASLSAKVYVDDVLDTVHDYSKIINDKGVSSQLGVSGNTIAVAASHVLAFGFCKLKQAMAKKREDGKNGKALKWKPRRRKDDGDDDPDNKTGAKAVALVLKTLLPPMGYKKEDMPTPDEVEEWLDKRDEEEADEDGDDDKEVDILKTIRKAAAVLDAKQTTAERTIGSVLRETFAKLGASAQFALRETLSHGNSISPAEAALAAIDRTKWERELTAALHPVLYSAALSGAAAEYTLYKLSRSGKAWTKDTVESLPRRVLDAAKEVTRSILERGWIGSIVDGTIKVLRRALRRNSSAGKVGHDLADAAAGEALVGAGAEKAAKKVARNEAAAAVNAGQAEVRGQLVKAGAVAETAWVTRRDEKVRTTHAAADGQRVRPGRSFKVGGHDAYYPGDPGLPISERANCRCKAVTVYVQY